MSGSIATTIHNERVKLRASSLSNIGIAFIVGGLVAPLVTRTLSFDWPGLLDVVWIGVGIAVRRRAIGILGELR